MSITLYEIDIPQELLAHPIVAIDTETMGLNPHRDRLCLIQLSCGDGHAHLVQIPKNSASNQLLNAPNLVALLSSPSVLKLFHFGRFDIAVLTKSFGVLPRPVYCTKIAARLALTNTDRYGLKDLCSTLLGIEIGKQQQNSDWGTDSLSTDQMNYAASDVLHLHALREKLDQLLIREGRMSYAKACFSFLPHRALLDLAGWPEVDIFAH